MFRFLSIVLWLVCSTCVPAGEKLEKKEASNEVEVRFRNGSNVRMTLLSRQIDVVTAYGKLTVPVEDVKQIEFGMHMPEGTEAKVAELIERLGHEEYRQRQAAVKGLVELKHYGYHALLKASRSSNLETSKRAQEALAQIKEKVSEKLLTLSSEDRLVTQRFTILGKIQMKSIKAKTEYFGEVDMVLHQIATLRSITAPGDVEIAVDAAKYAVPGAWMETDVIVETRSRLVITASGSVDQWPQTPGQYMVQPKGQMHNFGMPFPGGVILGKGAGVNLRNYSGTLLGRVGPDGPILVLGDHYDSTPAAEGKLFLCIGPSHWGNPNCTGSYQVKVEVKE